MKFPFYESLTAIVIDGRKYNLNLSVGNVLRYFDLRRNPNGLKEADINEVALSWFLPSLRNPSVEKAAEIISVIEKDYIDTEKRKIETRKVHKKVVDFTFDSGYIYAAFMQVYGIDLYEQADKLHWRKFIFMFESLPEDTAISQIMRIRAKEPDPKAKPEEIQRLSELKVLYALPDEGDTRVNDKKSLNGLFDFLLNKAKAGEFIG